jgi:myo-inositol-1(or 4)-monophosphatase
MEPVGGRALDVARLAAREAGRIQLDGLTRGLRVGHKGVYDLVTDVDRRCEEAITRILMDAFPQAGLLAEESRPEGPASETDEVWIVDPLDGTTNYARGYPVFCVSLALRRKDQIVLGVVYEPLRDETFEAVSGGGSRLNGLPIRVTETADLAESLLATGFPYDRLEHPETNLDRFCTMTMRTRGVRRGGSAALDLCYVACGRLDGFWEIRLNPWDVSAGALIVTQAGGKVSSLSGGPFDWTGKEILASNGVMHESMLAALADPWPGTPCFG